MLKPEEIKMFTDLILEHETQIDAEQDLVDAMGLWSIAELRPYDFDEQVEKFKNEQSFTGDHAHLHFQVHLRMKFAESIQQRTELMNAAKRILTDNGTPYRPQYQEPEFAAKLEVRLIEAQQHIEQCEAELLRRKIRGRAEGVFDEQPEFEIMAELQGAKNERRKCLKRLGRDGEAAPAGSQ